MAHPDTEKQYPPKSHRVDRITLDNALSSQEKKLSSIKKLDEIYKVEKFNSLWYALYFPQLTELNEIERESYLNQLAVLLKGVSSNITIKKQAIVCEVRSSLRYFDGIDNIHEIIKESIESKLRELELPEYFSHAACPTITGSLLLARSGRKLLIYRKENLRSALGKLSIDVLDISKESLQKLNNMGVRYLNDLWLLPSNGLQVRFGNDDLVTTINKALSLKPEPICNFTAPPNFSTCYVLPYEIEEINQLLLVAERMLTKSCEFLRNHDLSIASLQVSLSHHRELDTVINIGMRLPSRSEKHFSQLLETHLGNLKLPAPVVAVKLELNDFEPFHGHSESLSLECARRHGEDNRDLVELMEQLVARLGKDFVYQISAVSDHCPEFTVKQLRYDQARNSKVKQEIISAVPRPFMLLQHPKELSIKGGKLYNENSITIISGPERIETHWWHTSHVLRDYYMAVEQNGSRLWIYREREKERKWYLHGYFS